MKLNEKEEGNKRTRLNVRAPYLNSLEVEVLT